jgi:hypothetical protein
MTEDAKTLSTVQKIHVLLAETRRCIGDDNPQAALRKVMAIELLLRVEAEDATTPPTHFDPLGDEPRLYTMHEIKPLLDKLEALAVERDRLQGIIEEYASLKRLKDAEAERDRLRSENEELKRGYLKFGGTVPK